MTDQTFGELRQEDNYGWWGKQALDFGGESYPVQILIRGGYKTDEITQLQRTTFEEFIKKWPTLQDDLIEAIIKYYYEDQYRTYGPEDEEELKEWWPELKTKEALLQAVTLEMIVVPPDRGRDKRSIYLLFSRIWGGEDLDDNGIGVHYVNEEIDEIGYKDMAF